MKYLKIIGLGDDDGGSHPTRVRGLKWSSHNITLIYYAVAPHPGAWIEILYPLVAVWMRYLSHPTRVRGLKCRMAAYARFVSLSHPTRVRGLKFLCGRGVEQISHVAPHPGAWIEISQKSCCFLVIVASHPTRVRGLKFPGAGVAVLLVCRRTPPGCVD